MDSSNFYHPGMQSDRIGGYHQTLLQKVWKISVILGKKFLKWSIEAHLDSQEYKQMALVTCQYSGTSLYLQNQRNFSQKNWISLEIAATFDFVLFLQWINQDESFFSIGGNDNLKYPNKARISYECRGRTK